MPSLMTKRPITEKLINSVASQHRPNFSSHIKWRKLLPVGDEVDDKLSGNCSHQVLKDVVMLRKGSRKVGFLKALSPSSRSNIFNDRNIHCDRESYNFARTTRVWIAAWRPTAHLESNLGPLRLRARERKYDQRPQWSDEDGRRCKPSQFSEANREEEEEEECSRNDNRYDAILVLAGGQVAGGGVPAWVERRLDKALDLQRSNYGVLCKIVCLGGGTPHRAPILSPEGFVVHESSSCADYLHRRGAPFSNVIKEWGSYDTIGNGYFSLTQHVIPRRWRTLAVVTSEFHMSRTRAIFEWIFGLQGAGIAFEQVEQKASDKVVAAARGSQAQGFQLHFHSVPDHGFIDKSIVQARMERERRSIENLNIMIQQIHNLEMFHEWFHTQHKAYNTKDQHLFGKEEKLDPALLSY